MCHLTVQSGVLHLGNIPKIVPPPPSHIYRNLNYLKVRIPDSYDERIMKICNLWTFWPLINLIKLFVKLLRIEDTLVKKMNLLWGLLYP